MAWSQQGSLKALTANLLHTAQRSLNGMSSCGIVLEYVRLRPAIIVLRTYLAMCSRADDWSRAAMVADSGCIRPGQDKEARSARSCCDWANPISQQLTALLQD